MAWRQVISPNIDDSTLVVYFGVIGQGSPLADWYGDCAAVVRNALGIANPSGSTAWAIYSTKNQHNHADRDWPRNVWFPIWFSGYGGAGHVALMYIDDNGVIAIKTSPYTHKAYFDTYNDVDRLAKGYGVTYEAWSEDFAGVQVIEWVDDAPAAPKYEVVETYPDGKQIQLNKQPTNLWGMNYDFDYMKDHPVEVHNQGEIWTVTNKVHHQDGYDYYRRDGQVDGFNVLDCDDYTPPQPPVVNDPLPPTQPETPSEPQEPIQDPAPVETQPPTPTSPVPEVPVNGAPSSDIPPTPVVTTPSKWAVLLKAILAFLKKLLRKEQ